MKGTASQPHHRAGTRKASAARRPGAHRRPKASGITAAWPRPGTGRGAQPAEPDGGTPGHPDSVETLLLPKALGVRVVQVAGHQRFESMVWETMGLPRGQQDAGPVLQRKRFRGSRNRDVGQKISSLYALPSLSQAPTASPAIINKESGAYSQD